MSNRRLVTATTLATEHGIPRETAYKLARSGMIPCYRVGP